MADLKKLTEGTVDDAKAALGDLKGFELAELRDLEKAGAGRKTLLEAIEAEEARREEDSQTADDPVDDRAARFATMSAKFD